MPIELLVSITELILHHFTGFRFEAFDELRNIVVRVKVDQQVNVVSFRSTFYNLTFIFLANFLAHLLYAFNYCGVENFVSISRDKICV